MGRTLDSDQDYCMTVTAEQQHTHKPGKVNSILRIASFVARKVQENCIILIHCMMHIRRGPIAPSQPTSGPHYLNTIPKRHGTRGRYILRHPNRPQQHQHHGQHSCTTIFRGPGVKIPACHVMSPQTEARATVSTCPTYSDSFAI